MAMMVMRCIWYKQAFEERRASATVNLLKLVDLLDSCDGGIWCWRARAFGSYFDLGRWLW